MSDKEFDKLFKDGFEQLEVKPSGSLWPLIEKQLDTPKKSRVLPVFWMAAASVVMIFVAGLYFFRPEHKIRLQVKNKAETPVEQEILNPVSVKASEQIEKRILVQSVKKNPNAPGVKKVKEVHTDVSNLAKEVITISKVPVKAEAQNAPLIKEATLVVPDQNNSESLVTAMSILPEPAISEPVAQNKSRIKSVGDLVNFVVSKVDQRQDKIIEMSDNDEGTHISGINIGVLKIKSGKNKSPGTFKVNFK
ncbi:MAG TPA: hypothetical protein VNI52_02380 [Sphingobacteriaceae bacterium]|nr:hypothetical protein [Sphingobacteriaceae bacterium]